MAAPMGGRQESTRARAIRGGLAVLTVMNERRASSPLSSPWSSRLLCLATSAVVAACGAQADPTYRGEPLARIRGIVVSKQTVQPPPLDVALVWKSFLLENGSGATPLNARQSVATRAAVSGQFPASFTVDVMTPPPSEVMVACHPGDPSRPSRFAVAAVLGIRQTADGGNVQASDIFGQAPGFLVVYADSDIGRSACPVLSPITAVALSPGYHLLQKVSPEAFALDPSSDFAETAGGLATPISLEVQATPIAREVAPFFAKLDVSSPSALCLPQALARDETGRIACRVVMGLAGASTCNAPGLSRPDWPTAAAFQRVSGMATVCELAQLPLSALVDGTCTTAAAPGFCYVTKPQDTSGCEQAIRFSPSGAPPPGAFVALACAPLAPPLAPSPAPSPAP